MTLRRDFLKAGGALVVGFHLRESLLGQEHRRGRAATVAGPPDPKQVDTWLAIHADNTATVYIGFAELGQGNSTALLQVAAEELDMDMSQLKTVRLDTNVTPNQGGTYSSASIQRGGPQVRTAAAEARQALLQLASKRLSRRWIVSRYRRELFRQPAGSVSYGELVGDKPFHLAFTGSAPVKSSNEYKVVGTPVPRNDLPDKVSGKYVYMQHARVPGCCMAGWFARAARARMAPAQKWSALDETSIREYSRRARFAQRRFYRRGG